MLFPKFHIDEVLRQEQRDLTRFDLDSAMPEHFLPEFPAPIYLTTRKDLGDASRGQLVTLMNYYELFDGILNPKQLEGLRLLVTPFPQQQFNSTADRPSAEPSRGVACLDCHANGHTNAATHLSGDARPQNFRHRIDTPTLRGVNFQQLFGSQRALKSIEDFTEFEQRGACFDGDIVIAVKKGVNILERGSQVHAMAEFQAILDFPPAPKLDLLGRLNSGKDSESELRGQALFFGQAQCGSCHQAPYYTDNLMHDLRTERFLEPQDVQGRMAMGDEPIKIFPLRGIGDSPPYLHDGRLLTLEDTVEFFNLVLGTKLTSGGIVRHASSATPAGHRDIDELAALCKENDSGSGCATTPFEGVRGVASGTTLFVKSDCGFSRAATLAVESLHLARSIQIRNVTEDDQARRDFEAASGRTTAPCLVLDGDLLFESVDIVERLASIATEL